jgi:hypothetical protein
METKFGDTDMWFNDKSLLHRENNLPAVEYKNGDKLWFIDSKLHREDGPAVILSSGLKSWYLDGIEYSEDEYKKKMRSKKLKDIL